MNEDWQPFSSRLPATSDAPDVSPNSWYPPPNWSPWCTPARITTSTWPTAPWPPTSPNTRSPSMSPFASTSSSAPTTPATKRPGAPKLAGQSFTPPPPKLAHAPSPLHRRLLIPYTRCHAGLAATSEKPTKSDFAPLTLRRRAQDCLWIEPSVVQPSDPHAG